MLEQKRLWGEGKTIERRVSLSRLSQRRGSPHSGVAIPGDIELVYPAPSPDEKRFLTAQRAGPPFGPDLRPFLTVKPGTVCYFDGVGCSSPNGDT